MNLKYEVSTLAQNDLRDIWNYTFLNWSVNQANKYYRIIIKEIDLIRAEPKLGRSIQTIKKLHRIRSIKSHVIVYKVENEKIWIDRILHKGMDIK